MIGGGIHAAPAAMVVGLFVAPLAMVGAIGLTAAAVGAAVGALGAGTERVLIQVIFDDSRGFIAVCDSTVGEQIAADAKVARRIADSQAKQRLAEIPEKWRKGPIAIQAPQALPSPGTPPVIAAPSQTHQAGGAPVQLEATPDESGIFGVATTVISATGNLAAEAAQAASTSVEEAYSTVAAKADDAWQAASSFFARNWGKNEETPTPGPTDSPK